MVAKLEDLREWLTDRIDGSEETRGEDSLISHFINQIDALPSEIAEPRGCPTPGACSAVDELADLKQRLLPQYLGRAERAENAKRMAEHERDALLEELIVRRTAIANLHNVIDGMRDAPSATAAQVECGYDRSASLNAGHYVCLCGGACSHHTTREQP